MGEAKEQAWESASFPLFSLSLHVVYLVMIGHRRMMVGRGNGGTAEAPEAFPNEDQARVGRIATFRFALRISFNRYWDKITALPEGHWKICRPSAKHDGARGPHDTAKRKGFMQLVGKVIRVQ